MPLLTVAEKASYDQTVLDTAQNALDIETTSARVDALNQAVTQNSTNIATLNTSTLKLDGSSEMGGDLNVGMHQVENILDATSNQDATSLSQVNSKFTLGIIGARRIKNRKG